MQTIEGIKDLLSLNWLEAQAATLPTGKAKQRATLAQIENLRSRLPVSLLTYHDRMIRQKRPSAKQTTGSSCPCCHIRLPIGTLHELRKPGQFTLCPQCGVFLTTDEPPARMESLEQAETPALAKTL